MSPKIMSDSPVPGIMIPPTIKGVPESTPYRVYVNGHPCPVYDTRVFFELNNQYLVVSFTNFDFATSVRVVVESQKKLESVRIRPTSRGIN